MGDPEEQNMSKQALGRWYVALLITGPLLGRKTLLAAFKKRIEQQNNQKTVHKVHQNMVSTHHFQIHHLGDVQNGTIQIEIKSQIYV